MTRLSTRAHLGLALCLVVALHLLTLTQPLGSDEGGFSIVATMWHLGGDQLYGPQWVDRPPGLISTFWLADHLGSHGIRLMALLASVVVVLACAGIGWLLRGRAGLLWTVWTTAVLTSTTSLKAYQLNGELLAIAWISLSMLAVLAGLLKARDDRRALLAAVASGAAAMVALLTKQNFIDGFAFAGVLLLGTAIALPESRRRALLMLLGGLVGAVLAAVPALVWAVRGPGLHELIYAMYGFRVDASAVLASGPTEGPDERSQILLVIAFTTGLAVLAIQVLAMHGRVALRRRPVAWALLVTGVIEVAGILGGGSYWRHYLIALVPTVLVAAGIGATRLDHARWAALTTRVLIVLTVVGGIGTSLVEGIQGQDSAAAFAADWLEQVSDDGDQVVVPYTHASVIWSSGLTTPYPYSWSLPARTLDPDSRILADLLDDPSRSPEWVIPWEPLDTWGLDPDGVAQAALEEHYRVVADICGREVWLRADVERPRVDDVPATCS